MQILEADLLAQEGNFDEALALVDKAAPLFDSATDPTVLCARAQILLHKVLASPTTVCLIPEGRMPLGVIVVPCVVCL